MIEAFFLVVAAAKIINDLSAKSKIKDVVKRNGLDHDEWNKFRQETIFDKYLWNVNACPEQEYLTTWELYQMAQKELREDGYVWNPAWDRYTPRPDTCEYVRGTQIYNNLLNSEFHRYGEDLSLQDEIFKNVLIGEKDIYAESLKHKTDGPTQYEKYLLLKTIYNNPNLQRPLSNMDMEDEEPLYNKYGEPFHWYDDLMPFTPSKVYIMKPSEKTFEEYRAKGIDLASMQRNMKQTFHQTHDHRVRMINERNERVRNSRIR